VFGGRIYVIRHELKKYPHAHLLMVSKPDAPMRLRELSHDELEDLQNNFIGPDVNCRIDVITEGTTEQVSNYIYDEDNAHPEKPDSWAFYPYRNSLLEKLKIADQPSIQNTRLTDRNGSMVMKNNTIISTDDNNEKHITCKQDNLKNLEIELKGSFISLFNIGECLDEIKYQQLYKKNYRTFTIMLPKSGD
jgi:hypothetical protein